MTELIQPETIAHWWCRRCGRWEVCDDRDLCIECAFTVPDRRRRAQSGSVSPSTTPSAPQFTEVSHPWH